MTQPNYLRELIEFFEISQNFNQDKKKRWDDEHAINDDEVVVQMTYEDEKTEDEINPRRSSHLGAHIPSTISELCNGVKINRAQYIGGTQGSGMNHSTMHLDGEKSLNDNSLHFVSFFSVSEEMLMKKNLFLNSESHEDAIVD